MKILIISTLYPPHVVGGAEKAAAELAEALVRQGHEVVAASLYPESREVVEDRNGVRVYRLPIDNVYWPFSRKKKPNWFYRLVWHVREIWNPAAARRIAKILDIEKPEVVNTHNVCGFSLAVWKEIKNRKIRLVHTVHDCYLLCSRSVLFRNGHTCTQRCWDCKLLTFNRKNLSRLPDSLVSVSRYTLNEHLRRDYFQGVPTTIIYNILGAETIAPRLTLDPKSTKEGLIFGFIGRIEEEKGIETLLLATRQLRSRDWKLKIAGKGLDEYVEDLRTKFSDPKIEWLGFSDAARFYSSVDVIIIPSLVSEALPYVCVESLHAGKALICASSGGIPEIAQLSEVVEFFPPGDAHALAERMNQALVTSHKWRLDSRPDATQLKAFKEECVVETYLREYVAHEYGP